ncbi:MAG: LacI family DNA-binding transcriptional regulator [Chloroflexota bacterium]
MEKLTLEDIARLAGVSPATASRAINNRPDVSPAVRQRVSEVLQETGFQPNAAARSLASQRSDMIGLVISRTVQSLFADPYFPRLAEGIAQACNQHHHTFSLFVEYEVESIFRRITRRGLLDGVIVQVEALDNPLLPKLLKTTLPMVVLGRPPAGMNVSYLDVNNVQGAYRAVSHLIRLGHERIGTITGPIASGSGQDRLAGYRQALAEHGITPDEAWIVEGNYTEEGGYAAAQQLMQQKLSALFISSDSMARGVMRAIAEASLSVPADIAIVSFDDLPPATLSTPQLTTIRQPIKRVGIKAVETLLDVIEHGPQPARVEILETELIVRGSCGASLR